MPIFNNNSGEAQYSTPGKRYWRTTIKDRVPVKLHLMLLLCNLLLRFIPDSVLIVNQQVASRHRFHKGPVTKGLLGTVSTVRDTVRDTVRGTMTSSLSQVPDVDIDPKGRFKYILVKVWDPKHEEDEKYIVRGYLRCGYHGDIYDEVEPVVQKLGLESDCPGGGRIEHDPANKYLKVFGYSTGYGRADHSISTEILKKHFPEYKVEWSNDGY